MMAAYDSEIGQFICRISDTILTRTGVTILTLPSV